MYSELQDSRLTLMEVMDEYVERRVLSEATYYGANTFIKSKNIKVESSSAISGDISTVFP